MKTIIAGSRNITDIFIVRNAVHDAWVFQNIDVTEVVSGGARGVDFLGEILAKEEFFVPLTLFPAQWETLGKKAGFMRNLEMADYADALIAIWDGKSKGTKHMIDIAKRKGLEVFVYEIKEENIS